MHQSLLIVFSLLLSACLPQLNFGPEESTESVAVRNTFYDYKFALLNNLGKEAADLISKRTILHYDFLRRLALKSKEKELNKVAPFDRLVVLAIRHQIQVELLLLMSGKDVFGQGIKENWVAKNTVAPYDIGKINIYGDYASTRLTHWGVPLDFALEFLRENGEWKINLIPILEKTSVQFALKLDPNQNENKQLVQILEGMTNRNVSDKIWEPLVKK